VENISTILKRKVHNNSVKVTIVSVLGIYHWRTRSGQCLLITTVDRNEIRGTCIPKEQTRHRYQNVHEHCTSHKPFWLSLSSQQELKYIQSHNLLSPSLDSSQAYSILTHPGQLLWSSIWERERKLQCHIAHVFCPNRMKLRKSKPLQENSVLRWTVNNFTCKHRPPVIIQSASLFHTPNLVNRWDSIFQAGITWKKE
jgi:hypothetical protein